MKKSKYAKFYALLKQANANGLILTKEDAVSDYTDGRTTSLRSLTQQQLYGLEQKLSSTVQHTQLVNRNGSKVLLTLPGSRTVIDAKQDKMRKAIIAIFRDMGRTAADAKAWAEKYGTGGEKRAFNDYTAQELWQLIRNAEKVREDFKKALNKQ